MCVRTRTHTLIPFPTAVPGRREGEEKGGARIREVPLQIRLGRHGASPRRTFEFKRAPPRQAGGFPSRRRSVPCAAPLGRREPPRLRALPDRWTADAAAVLALASGCDRFSPLGATHPPPRPPIHRRRTPAGTSTPSTTTCTVRWFFCVFLGGKRSGKALRRGACLPASAAGPARRPPRAPLTCFTPVSCRPAAAFCRPLFQRRRCYLAAACARVSTGASRRSRCGPRNRRPAAPRARRSRRSLGRASRRRAAYGSRSARHTPSLARAPPQTLKPSKRKTA